MTGHGNRNAVGCAGRTNVLSRRRYRQVLRDRAVGTCLAGGNRQQRIPNGHLDGRATQIERQIGPEVRGINQSGGLGDGLRQAGWIENELDLGKNVLQIAQQL